VTQPRVILITGACAAGKSTVAQALAERFPRSVHVRGDGFRRMIVNGRVDKYPWTAEEADAQRFLRHALMADAVNGFEEAGFTAIAQDVIIGREELSRVLARIRARPLHLVVLTPSPAVLAERERLRAKEAYDEWITPTGLDAALREETPHLGLWLDSSEQTAAETADAILERLDEARID
jgi:chloramphenicol 3-O-phosphotransferase